MLTTLLLALFAQEAPPEPPKVEAKPPAKQIPASEQQVLTAAGLRAAERGLKFLSEHQLEDGSWPGDVGYKLEDSYRVWNKSSAHVGVTALAGMAFLAGGHVPGRGPYGDAVEKAVGFILKQVRHAGGARRCAKRTTLWGPHTRAMRVVLACADLPSHGGGPPAPNLRAGKSEPCSGEG